MKEYSLLKEDKELLPKWRDEVIASLDSTKPMSPEDKAAAEKAILEIYEKAKLEKPKVIFMKSPFAARFAVGLYAASLWLKKNKKPAADADAAAAAVAVADAAADAAAAVAVAAAADAAAAAASDAAAAAAFAASDAAAAAASDAAAAAASDAAAAAAFAADAVASDAAAAAAAADAVADASPINAETYSFGSVESRVKASLKLGLGSFGLKVIWQTNWRFSFRWRFVRRLVFAGFFRRTKMKADLSGIIKYENLLFNSGYSHFAKGAVFVSDRPLHVHRDNEKRLHNMNGKAAEWRDGSGLYAIHGVRMPAWICETPPEKLDIEKIMSMTNVEQRLMAIKKVGMERALTKLNSKVISEGPLDDSGLIYKLHSVELAGSYERLFEMSNPSEPKTHLEFVDPGCETIEHADMWRRGFDNFKTTKYQPTEERA